MVVVLTSVYVPDQLLNPSEGPSMRVGDSIGLHRAASAQILAVVEGDGWIRGADETKTPIAAGGAVYWSEGEVHDTGTDTGLVAIVAPRRQAHAAYMQVAGMEESRDDEIASKLNHVLSQFRIKSKGSRHCVLRRG